MTEKKRTTPRKSTTKKKVRAPKDPSPMTEDTPLTPADVASAFLPSLTPPTPEEKLENTRATMLQWSLNHYHTQAVSVEQVLATADAFVTYVTTGQLPVAPRTPAKKKTSKVTPIKKKKTDA